MFEDPVVEVFDVDCLRTVSTSRRDSIPVCPDATTVAAFCQLTGQGAIMCTAGSPYIVLCNGSNMYCSSISASDVGEEYYDSDW